MATKTMELLLSVVVGMAFLLNMVASQSRYVNHTVGGDVGWFFNLTSNTTSADYSAWASKQSFNLGDFLLFNTNTNHSVIHTYNETTYKSCSTQDASDSDTFYYGSGELGKDETVAVPLTIEGTQYFFSDSYDGVQCQNGMAFEIKVGHGLGLPPSLNQPPPPAYVPPPSPANEEESPPITVVATPPSGGASASLTCVASMLAALLIHLA